MFSRNIFPRIVKMTRCHHIVIIFSFPTNSSIRFNTMIKYNALFCHWHHLYWLIGYVHVRFYIPPKNFSLIRRCHHCRWRAAKFRPMLEAQGLWSLLCHTVCDTGPLFFQCCLKVCPIQGCGGCIITWKSIWTRN